MHVHVHDQLRMQPTQPVAAAQNRFGRHHTHPPTQCWLQQSIQRTAGSHGKYASDSVRVLITAAVQQQGLLLHLAASRAGEGSNTLCRLPVGCPPKSVAKPDRWVTTQLLLRIPLPLRRLLLRSTAAGREVAAEEAARLLLLP